MFPKKQHPKKESSISKYPTLLLVISMVFFIVCLIYGSAVGTYLSQLLFVVSLGIVFVSAVIYFHYEFDK
jgi:capsule polysaccharide export protein KpsE/RkpR